MKTIKKPVCIIIALVILAFAGVQIFGISTYYGDINSSWIKGVGDIRWGIDIRGGVDVTFAPPSDYEGTITSNDVDAAESVIKNRMVHKKITDYEIYKDYSTHRIIVRFPWQASDTDFDPAKAVKELGEMAELSFREGDLGYYTEDYTELPLVLTGRQVNSAGVHRNPQTDEWEVTLDLDSDGAMSFADATSRLASIDPREGGVISIWLDNVRISAPNVKDAITSGQAVITGGQGGFPLEEARDLANKINGGALPYSLVTESFSVIDPTMGESARDNMLLAGVITFGIIAVFMIFRYKVLGGVAVVGLIGQIFGTFAILSGFVGEAFQGGIESFTMTVPGLAGIILSIGMGIDANVITAERIKEEIRAGKTLDGAVQSGYKRAFSAILDGNITMIIVAFVLMGAFGTPGSVATDILKPLFFWFGPSPAGAIYAFGWTLIVGAILNLFFGVLMCRLMTYSLVKFKALRNPVLFGGYKNEEEKRKAAETPTFDAVSHRKRFLIAPISIIAVALILIIIPQYGLEVAIEFKGGTILNYTYEGDIDTSAVQSKVEELAADKVNIKTGTAIGSTELKTMTIEFASKSGLTVEVQHSISQALETDFEASNLQTSGSQDVSPTMGKAFFLKCFVAVLFSFILMLVYIALRFKNLGGLSAGAFTIFALLINVIIVFAVFVFMRFPIDANFMAVILTILCYTINDTIVVFDRIRENRTLHGKRMSFDGLVNHSVKQSFRRSLNTTITTCIAMLTISIVAIIAGVSSMLTFAFPLLIGLIMGFMTSLYTVGPFWASWKLRKPKAKA